MKMNNKTKLLIIFLIISGSCKIHAQTLYSMGGLGELRHFMTVRSSGLGGTGLSLKDSYSINLFNPSLWSLINNASINGNFLYEGIKFENYDDIYTLGKSQLNGLGFVIKGSKKTAIGIGLMPLSDADYSISMVEADSSLTQHLSSKGGLSKVLLGFSINPKNFISLGLSLNYILGKFEEIWRADFKDESYIDMNNVITRSLKGTQFTLSCGLFLKENLSIGIAYNTTMKLSSSRNISTSYSVYEESDIKIEVPNSFGIGAGFKLNKKVLITGDFFKRNYNKIKYNNSTVNGYKNSNRISCGIEYTPEEEEKHQYRIGGFQFDSYLDDPLIGSIRERAVTLGYGMLFYDNNVRLDFAGQFGIRTSSSEVLSSDKIFRLLISFSGGEEWFVRGRR